MPEMSDKRSGVSGISDVFLILVRQVKQFGLSKRRPSIQSLSGAEKRSLWEPFSSQILAKYALTAPFWFYIEFWQGEGYGQKKILDVEDHQALFSLILSAFLVGVTFLLWLSTRNLWLTHKRGYRGIKKSFLG